MKDEKAAKQNHRINDIKKSASVHKIEMLEKCLDICYRLTTNC